MTNKKEAYKEQSKIYEFAPSDKVSHDEVVELLQLIRIGVGGEVIANASPQLKKHFKQVA